jgi:MFS family permease
VIEGAAPLRGNRDFLLLQAGQLGSTLGSVSASVAYPLLVLATTHSPLLAGVVGVARVLPGVLRGVLGGVAADRYDRRRLMVLSDVARAVAVGSLAVALLADRLSYGHILAVALVEGAFSVLFQPAATAALRSVVATDQLPAAVSAQQARSATASLVGPPLGGALFGIGRAVPFVADAVSYTFSVVSLLLIRTPFQESRDRPRGGATPRHALREGWRFLWDQPFLRTTTFLYGLTNFVGPGVLLGIVVLGERQGLSGGTIGLMLAAFSAGLLVGSAVSGRLRRVLSRRAILLLELCAWPLIVAFVGWPNAYVLAAAMLPAAIAIPVTDSVVVGHRLTITPDHLIGRVESVRSTIALALAPLGSLLAGFLLGAFSPRVALLPFVAVAFVLPVWAALSPALRTVSAEEPPVPAGAGGGRSPSRRECQESRECQECRKASAVSAVRTGSAVRPVPARAAVRCPELSGAPRRGTGARARGRRRCPACG